ncbi:hypothetical protein [Clostridium sp. BJN0013]|uniref:hypothetical protein n=1 Tax=Clostridium sp. BJN0013 TaxID=3236840 RepID=UPI0034C6492A
MNNYGEMLKNIRKGDIPMVDEKSVKDIGKYEGECICEREPKELFFVMGKKYLFRQEGIDVIIVQDGSEKEVTFSNDNDEKSSSYFGDYFEVY